MEKKAQIHIYYPEIYIYYIVFTVHFNVALAWLCE